MAIKSLELLSASDRKKLIKEIVSYGDKQFKGRKGEVSKEEIVGVFLDGLQQFLVCDEIEGI